MPEVIASCRGCGSGDLTHVLSLGSLPLANALVAPEQLEDREPRFPLDLVRCSTCTLVQITVTVPPQSLFTNYIYFSSFSETMVRHARELVAHLVSTRRLGPHSYVVEIASNDGYLLQHYRAAGVPVLGIEPALNVARVAREERGVPTLAEFFDAALAERLAGDGRRADVIHAHNVVAHVPDLHGFLRGIVTFLKEDGVAVIEVPYLRDLIAGCEFDTIYHEHLCYFSLTALQELIQRHGLVVLDVQRVPIHGGSLRLQLAPAATASVVSPAVATLLQEEQAWVRNPDFYARFACRVRAIRLELRQLVRQLKDAGSRLAAYGAAAKGAVLLNYCGFDRAVLDYVADRSVHKQGRYMPGVRLPIRSPEALLETAPDYVLLLAWNVATEVLEQQAAYRARGGRFIVPIPEVRIV